MPIIRKYYELTKPGIIYGNALTAVAGFLLAARGQIDLRLFFGMLVGTSLIIASACVFNNYIDRGIDGQMARTKKRALVSGEIAGRNALIYATVLGIAGAVVVGLYANLLTLGVDVGAFFFYVVLYGLAKRHTVHSTLVGSIPGAAPIVAGYVAAANQFDVGAALVFLSMVLWQMPHFYAIAMYRFDDYKAAKLPVLPVKKGLQTAKIQILLYVLAFIVASLALVAYGYAGYSYGVVVGLLGLAWLGLGIRGFRAGDDKSWARQMFFFSLIVMMSFSIMLSLTAWLP